MPSVSKHRKVKRPGVVIKRTQCPRNRPPKARTPSYEKLKNNNHSLARALSQEKQESQSLFSQNVALIAEVHELEYACKRRDDIFKNVSKNAKDMLQLIINMSNCLTNTISSCQEFVSNTGNSYRSSTSSAGRRDSNRRMSTKSPAKGVVKPMVSGHTIQKPTINLSRVNMQNFQNVLSLTTIEESPSSPDINAGSPSSGSSRSPTNRISDSSRRQLNFENRRVRRISDRIPVVLIDDLDERRLSNRHRISDRFSGRFSKRKSGSLSESRIKRRSTDHQQNDRVEGILIKSPRVALSDVSKLLQNLQTVNVRTLEEHSVVMDETRCINSSTDSQNRENCSLRTEKQVDFQLSDSDIDDDICMNIPSRPMSRKFNPQVTILRSDIVDKTRILNGSSSFEKSNLDKTLDLNNESYNFSNNSKKSLSNSNSSKNNNNNNNNNSINDDPLEGPSWMFNDLTAPIDDNDSSDSESQSNVTQYKRSKINATHKENGTFTPVRTSTKLPNNIDISNNETPKKGNYSEPRINNNNNNNNNQENSPDIEMTMNFARFVTKNRGHSNRQNVNDFDDLDDPTIMLNIRQQTRKPSFNIDDLQLPVMESPIVNRPVVEPEITSTINIVSINGVMREQINYMPNMSMPRFSDVPVPISEDESSQENLLSPVVEKIKVPRKRKKQTTLIDTLLENDESIHNSMQSMAKKKKIKHKSNMNDKDPKAAKVVLLKLPSQNRKNSDESLAMRKALKAETNSDSESSNASSKFASSRPRRQKAPVNLQEPSLTKKLRRKD
ncbi:homeobox protein 5-like [Leptopilina boulardi]|uniref:homeobox protein 5-like n=1 Tax=Leptopilina boulardi TaxID=63433 RepID=UPI0021F542C7|nr:homeobox protein 5-like [Leptopilina boulardi]